jgi:transcription-repair coupling factor (superfamily II helicase)
MLQGSYIRFAPVELPESREVRVQRLYPRTTLKPAVRTMLVPAPKAGAGQAAGRQAPAPLGAAPLRDAELLTWCRELVESVFDYPDLSAG